MPEDQKSSFSEAVETGASAAHTICGAIKTGKAISSAAKGAAAGGPYGAVAGAVWAGRKHIGKIIVAVIALLMLPVLFVLMLPGLIFGGLTNAFSPSDPEIPILNSETAIIENANEITFTLNGILGEALDDVLARIEADFAASGADHMEVKNAYSGGPIYNANLFISQYCAAKDKDFESISLNDLAATLRENKQHLYSYTSKQEIRESTVTDPETGEETTVSETWMVYIGLGSRLQVFQSELIKKITAKNEIDLELPGQQPCAYFLVTSDQDSTFDFLASLFLSFCFIKLVRYADHNCEGGKLPVPVHILGEELTACGTIPDLSRRLSVIRSRNISMSCVFQNLAGLQNRYPQNLWQEIIGNCDAQLFLGCTDQLTAEFISARTGLASVAVSSKSKQLGTWRISNYTPEFRETSGVGKRPVLTPDEVLRLPLDQALIIIRGKKVLQVDKMDYSKHPEAKYLRSCKASAHVPEWRRLEEEAAKTPQPAPKPAPAAKKPAKRKATKPASPTDKSPKEAPAPKSAGTPEGIITTDKDSILS